MPSGFLFFKFGGYNTFSMTLCSGDNFESEIPYQGLPF